MTKHDICCVTDYTLLAEVGVRCVRDGLRWHLIESVPGIYDWSSFRPMLQAAIASGTQVIWDICHWGLPDWVDAFSNNFPEQFGAFAGAVAKVVCEEHAKAGVTSARLYCPINEISFWSWVGGDVEHFSPYGEGRGPELKRQLVKASVAAIRAVRKIDASARFMQAEPIIHISADDSRPEENEIARQHTASQFEAWDMLAGRRDSELGGSEDVLDIVGVNYYWNNQWVHEGERAPPGHPSHRPLHEMLEEIWSKYRRPIVIAETGTESGTGAGWLGYVMSEVRQAHRLNVPVLGVCLYPVMDYPGWDDERHCDCGLIEVDENWSGRRLRGSLVNELRAQQKVISIG